MSIFELPIDTGFTVKYCLNTDCTMCLRTGIKRDITQDKCMLQRLLFKYFFLNLLYDGRPITVGACS